ncbi:MULTISPECIES: YusW family protein [unclassified Rossellomorea]|uniref:YusW family protein n=1 Tax=unclassified Rossellomorea TaxID=2837526 RepID=UPI002603F249|nr:YusW family protein [uncultured Rossellomorea sp.]
MKKKLTVLALVFFSVFLLAGCNDKEEVKNPPEKAPVENTNNENNEQGAFPFTNFDLDVDYKDNKSIDVDYENEKDGVEAKYQDDLNGQNLLSDEAMDKLAPIFEGFDFDQNTDGQKVIQQVKEAFSVEEGYQVFELEITYSDGVEKEYRE